MDFIADKSSLISNVLTAFCYSGINFSVNALRFGEQVMVPDIDTVVSE